LTTKKESKKMTTIILTMLSLVISTAFVIVAFVWLAYEASKHNKGQGSWTTTVDQEEFKFIVAGGNLIKILPNMKKGELNEKDEVVESGKGEVVYKNPLLTLLKDRLGIYWVSIIWPLKKVHSFKIDKYSLRQESELPENHKLSDLIEVEKDFEVFSLRRFIPRPLLIKEVELKDGLTVDILVMTEWEVINPRRPVFNYKGIFFSLMDNTIEGAVNDYGNSVGYMDLIGKPLGRDSEFSDKIMLFIESDFTIPDIEDRKKSFARTVGIKLTNCYVVQFGLLESDQSTRDATKANALEIELAKAAETKAGGEAKAIERIAIAQAKAFAKPVASLIKLGVDPNLAAAQVGRKTAMEAVAGKDSKLTVFVEGGSSGNTGINISTTPPEKSE